MSACLAGEVPRYLTKGMYEEAKDRALEYQEIFGKGNYFLELQDHGIPDQQLVNQQLMKLSQETGIDVYKRQERDLRRQEKYFLAKEFLLRQEDT